MLSFGMSILYIARQAACPNASPQFDNAMLANDAELGMSNIVPVGDWEGERCVVFRLFRRPGLFAGIIQTQVGMVFFNGVKKDKAFQSLLQGQAQKRANCSSDP